MAGYAIAAGPAFVLLMIAAFGFSGCFLECSAPDPTQGWVAVAGMVLLLSSPIVAGVAFMKRSRVLWIIVIAVEALALVPLL